MQDSDDLHYFLANTINRKEGQARKHQFARSTLTPRSPKMRELGQRTYPFLDALRRFSGDSGTIVFLGVVADVVRSCPAGGVQRMRISPDTGGQSTF